MTQKQVNNEFKNDRDYTIIGFAINNNRRPIKHVYCNSIRVECTKIAQKFANEGHQIHHWNVYARRSSRFLAQFKPSDNIPHTI